MKQQIIITEYSESKQTKKGNLMFPPEIQNDVFDDVSYVEDEEDLEVEFSEGELDQLEEEVDVLLDSLDGDGSEEVNPEETGMVLEDVLTEFSEEMPFEEHDDSIILIPGSDLPLEEEEEEEVEEVEKDWAHDRDPNAFMSYIMDMYPSKIPRHSGQSTVGAERASNFLNAINKEISEAVKTDRDGVLDIDILEDVRVRIMNDLLTLKSLIKKLQKGVKDKHNKSSSTNNDIVKEATTPRVQLIMTPFERAMTGIIVNAVVSAGRPFEDVWEFLKKKYDWTDREEIAYLQLIQDLGFTIFKDRGMVGEEVGSDSSKQGVDFIKNYFA